jgi:hypothetical protein
MPNPRQMFDHALDAIKGYWHEYALDIQGRIHNDQKNWPVFAGAVLHIADIIPDSNTSTRVQVVFKAGTPKSGNDGVMGCFVWQNLNDFDVVNDGGDVWKGIIPSDVGVLNCLVAKGAYELQTTEYETNDTFTPNKKLYGHPGDAVTGNKAGVLTTASSVNSVNLSVCGVVSQGVTTNYNDVNVLTFWPVYLG